MFCITEIIIHVKPPTGLLYAGDDLKITTTWGKSHKHDRNSFHKLQSENNINSFERFLTKQGEKDLRYEITHIIDQNQANSIILVGNNVAVGTEQFSPGREEPVR